VTKYTFVASESNEDQRNELDGIVNGQSHKNCNNSLDGKRIAIVASSYARVWSGAGSLAQSVRGGHGGFLRKKIVVGKMREVTRMLHNWWRATKLAGSAQYKDNRQACIY
jgi:hypothetical protein